MPSYHYLIIGGGMAADAAARGIRELDAHGSIGIISAEADPPYARPPLSKALWKGDPLDSVWRKTSEAGVTLHLGRRAVTLDHQDRHVVDDEGVVYRYQRLLLATGGTPRRLPFGGDDIIYFRTLSDYRRLRAVAGEGKRVAVIGGGFIGSEVAAALALQGTAVTMLFPEDGICARVFPPELSRFLVQYYRDKGVDVHTGASVTGVRKDGGHLVVESRGAAPLTVDAVVAGIGIVPDTELATMAGLAVDNGIVVDARLRTTDPDIFAAGDVARFHAPALGTSIRVEHEDNAVTMGHAAGRFMAGDTTPYSHLPLFYSDLFELGYEAVGELDPRGEMVADWKEPNREGIVHYLSGGRVRGVLLWNTWGEAEAARQLIAETGPFTARELVGRLGAPARAKQPQDA